MLVTDRDVGFQFGKVDARYCVFYTAFGEGQFYRILIKMKNIDGKICLQVKVPIIEITMMWFPEVATWKITVALQFKPFDVYMFLAVFRERCR